MAKKTRRPARVILAILFFSCNCTLSFSMISLIQRRLASKHSYAAAKLAMRGISVSEHPDNRESGLQDLAQRVVETSSCRACLAVAGGGGQAISALASTPGASAVLLEGTIAYDRSSFRNYAFADGEVAPEVLGEDFSFASVKAASLLSEAALRRALQYTTSLKDMPLCVGVGCASALSSTSKRSMTRSSRAHVVVTSPDGRVTLQNITLAPQLRNRQEEDALVSNLLLRTIMQHTNPDDIGNAYEEAVTDEDTINTWKEFSLSTHRSESDEVTVDDAAELILSGELPAAVLIPRGNRLVPLAKELVLPSNAIIFPGSFNPPHHGHVALANAAILKMPDWRERPPPVLFELSIANPDKPSMAVEEVARRANLFLNSTGDNIQMPREWGILLTSAPLFVQKVDVYNPKIVKLPGTSARLTFVIGTDTMVRILNPKYYGGQDKMLNAVRDMGRRGVHFIVGGRLEQDSEQVKRFVSGAEELREMPSDVQDMFTMIREQDFRVDVSSKEIRKQLSEMSSTSSSKPASDSS